MPTCLFPLRVALGCNRLLPDSPPHPTHPKGPPCPAVHVCPPLRTQPHIFVSTNIIIIGIIQDVSRFRAWLGLHVRGPR